MASWSPRVRLPQPVSKPVEPKLTRAQRAWRVFKVMLGLALCIGALFGGDRLFDWAKATPYFAFKSVTVKTDEAKVPSSLVQATVQQHLDGNFITADLDALRASLIDVPWVHTVTVRRLWPDRLDVEIVPFEAIAKYEDGQLVSQEGELFSADASVLGEKEAALPNFYGNLHQIERITRYYKAFSELLAPLSARLTDINYSDRGSWRIVMVSDTIPPTTIELGQDQSTETVMDRLRDVVSAYPEVVRRLYGHPTRIDARYDRAFAATLPAP